MEMSSGDGCFAQKKVLDRKSLKLMKLTRRGIGVKHIATAMLDF
ncbi:hypothetical protein CCACVL1_01042 [Corchorus capsularis]|uniref:Uncharacterized protein n=1 Tax=Corchorus capsularis TaxID=210143 RepID=A0A1R3KRQ3_COCAP|nr:hypothetical protein CCACVL1_01042 [Corchorus capsularis]